MGYDNPQRGSAGAVVAIVAVFVALLLGGLVLLVLGGWFFMRAEVRQTEMVAEANFDRAVVEMEMAEQPAQVEVKDSVKIESQETPTRALTIEIDQDGAITFEGERTDFDDLNSRIQETGEDGDVRLTVQLKVHPRCLAQHVVAVQSACSELGVQDVRMSTLETQSSGTTGEDASVTAAAELP